MANQDRFSVLQQKLKKTHLPVWVDYGDEEPEKRLLVQRDLSIAALKEQVMNRIGQDMEQARLWHLWVAQEKLPGDMKIRDAYQSYGEGDSLSLRYSSGIEATTTLQARTSLLLTDVETTETLSIEKFPAVIGRFDQNDVTVDLSNIQNKHRISISRRHAEVIFSDGHFHIRNLSQNNVLVLDGQTIAYQQTHLLGPRCHVRLGKVTFVIDIHMGV